GFAECFKFRGVAPAVGEGEGAVDALAFLLPLGETKDVEGELVKSRILPICDVGGNRGEIPDGVLAHDILLPARRPGDVAAVAPFAPDAVAAAGTLGPREVQLAVDRHARLE